jgi:hypothetical protein
MLELTVTDEFALFFDALPDVDAEAVAAALDLIAAAGEGLAPDRARRSLLWYDGTRPALAQGSPLAPTVSWLELRVHEIAAYRVWQGEALRCLSSEAFSARLGALEPAAASSVLESVQALRQRLRAALYALPWKRGGRAHFSARTTEALREAFESVMQSVGLDPRQLAGGSGGLREVTLDELSPAVRIIYGLSPTQPLGHVLVGERLDRCYYGDSVSLAERRFAQFLARVEPAERAERRS